MNVVSVADVAAVLLMAIEVFLPYFKIVFSIMVAFYLSYGIRDLIVG